MGAVIVTAMTTVALLMFSYNFNAASVSARALTNPIVIENQQPGTLNWQLYRPGYQLSDDVNKQIKGYASLTSVNKGQSINFLVTVNPVQTYTLDIYRMGWYNGNGGRLMQHVGPLSGVSQPPCPVDAAYGTVSCSNWSVGYTLSVPTNWTDGIYLVMLTNANNYQSYINFVVRDDTRTADLLLQETVTTYQAYNNYPDDGATGKSLYSYNSYGPNTITGETRAAKVSFDRPYAGRGAGTFLTWEIYFLRWMERMGYDVSYSTDVDTHASGARLLNFKGYLSVGHDEYWSKEMYDAAEGARDAGVSLGFFGANDVYWQIRFEASAGGVPNRLVVCYKDSSIDPVPQSSGLKTVHFRDPEVNRPEQKLVGIQFTSQLPNNVWAAYKVINSNHWVYQDTGFSDGDTVTGTVGYETDRRFSNYPQPVSTTYTLLSQTPYTTISGGQDFSNSSIYTAPSGARVFGAGTLSWSWGLDNWDAHNIADPRLQETTENILDNFIMGTTPTRTPTRTATPTTGPASVYTDNLVNGWHNSSWSSSVTVQDSAYKRSGSYSLSCAYTGAYGGLFLTHNGFNTTGYQTLEFYINGGSASGQLMQIMLHANNTILNPVNLNDYIAGGGVVANTWRQVSIPLSVLSGSNIVITGIVIQDDTGGAQPRYYIDDMIFLAAPTPTSTSTPLSSATRTSTSTRTVTPTGTSIPTAIVTPTVTNTPSATSTPTATNTSTSSVTSTATNPPTAISTPTATSTLAASATRTPTLTVTVTPGASFTFTPIVSATRTPTLIVTVTNIASPTRTSTVIVTATVTRTHVPSCSISFTDVPPGSTFYPYVRCLACRNILTGYADNTFRPNDFATRGQLAKIISNAARFNEPVSGQTFQDVPPTSTFYPWVQRLASRNIMTGYPCGISSGESCLPPSNRPYFRVNINATRGQIAKIVAKTAQINTPPAGRMFEDVPPGSLFYSWVQPLGAMGVMNGYRCGGPGEPCVPPDNRPYFRWNSNITRGQTSKIVANTFLPSCSTP